LVATFLGAGKPEMFAQEIEQRGTRVNLGGYGFAVDQEVHR
jgi:hypothetical protein